MSRSIRGGISWAGLAAGPTAWAVSTQLNYSIAHWQCTAKTYPSPWFSALAILIALAGAALSWRAVSDPGHGVSPPETMRTRRFVAGASVGIGVLFALVMLMQMAAGLVFGGCEL
jgi:hypothetical protein